MAKMEVVYSYREVKEALINDIAINYSMDMEDVDILILVCDQDDDEAIRVVSELQREG